MATKKRTKRRSWGFPQLNLRNAFYVLTFLGGTSWFSGCYQESASGKQTSPKDRTIRDKEQNRTNGDEISDKDNGKRKNVVQDDDSPELPAVASKDRKNVVKHKYYTLLYNEKHEQATWVAYQLLKKYTEGTAKRQNNFRPDDAVATGSSKPADYSNSGYDRGHLAPAADFEFSKEAMSETFFMSNMSPQVHAFNAGNWKKLETKVRDWARERGKVYVVTGPILQDGLPTIGAENKVSIPKEYYKVIYDPAKKQMIGFIMQNRESFKDVAASAVSVDAIEKKTGIDFFPTLPDDLEDELEKQVKTKDWFTK